MRYDETKIEYEPRSNSYVLYGLKNDNKYPIMSLATEKVMRHRQKRKGIIFEGQYHYFEKFG